MIDTNKARPGSLEPAYDASVVWRYMAPAGHTLEMCRHPTYWSNVLREVRQQRVVGRHPWNKIEIIAEDGTWEAELRVTRVEGELVHTRLLTSWHEASRPGRRLEVPEGYTVEHVAGNGWRAMAPDGMIVDEKLPTESDATRAAQKHARKIAA